MLGAMSEKKKDKCHVVISYLFIMGLLIGVPNVTCRVLYITLFYSGYNQGPYPLDE